MVHDDAAYSRYLAGDPSAGDALILKYNGRLILYLSALTHDATEAEDLAVETFATILLKRPKIRPGGFQAYLYRSARNRALRFFALRRRRDSFYLEESQVGALLTVRPEDEFLRDERRQSVRRCLERIDPKCREALWLTYFEDMSYAEAAAVMGVNAKKVDNLLARGKRLMKTELEKEGITHADG